MDEDKEEDDKEDDLIANNGEKAVVSRVSSELDNRMNRCRQTRNAWTNRNEHLRLRKI